jgi:predicted AAA+ superfamily ATPase
MIPRALDLRGILRARRSCFVFGARATGKTELLRAALADEPGAVSIDLLRGDVYQRYLAQPSLFGDEVRARAVRDRAPFIVAVDEVQRVPALLDEVHSLLSELKGRVTFVLTGSSARRLKRGGANLLAGRALTYHLHPLSSAEVDVSLTDALQWGTLPAVVTEPAHRRKTLEAYVSTYLREEIVAEAIVRRVDQFARFLEVAGQANGEPINFSKLARECGVTTKTAQEYFAILVDTLLALRLDGWHPSVRRQLLQAPKFYFFDCGVLNALNGDLRAQLRPSSYRYGRLFETWVIQEVVRANDAFDLGLRLHHWRDARGREVDLLLSRNGRDPLVAMEIKSSSAPDGSFDALRLVKADHRRVRLWCVCTTPRAYVREGVEVLPWSEALGRLREGALG